jgi:hypothetical protein
LAVADDLHRDAWTKVLASPAAWNTADLHATFGAPAGTHFSSTLLFWSKVLQLTAHQRPSLDPTSADPAKQPVTVRQIGPTTTNENRDLQVIHTLSADGEDLGKALRPRAPAACTF